jgi:hypothetical protein
LPEVQTLSDNTEAFGFSSHTPKLNSKAPETFRGNLLDLNLIENFSGNLLLF